VNADVLARIRRRLRERGLEAYVAYTPSNVFYATGFQSYFLMQWWRMHGTVMALIPADERQSPALLVSDFEAAAARRQSSVEDLRTYRLWVDTRPLADTMRPLEEGERLPPRPAQYDTAEQDRHIRDAIQERGLQQGRIGTDLRYILKNSYDRLAAALPGVTWGDFTEDMYALRSIKMPWEVDRLRRATALSEAGMLAAAEHAHDTVTAAELRHAYTKGVVETALGDPRYDDYTDSWVLPAVGAGVAPEFGAKDSRVSPGALIKFDCGTTVGGYRSDGGRTFAFKTREPRSERLYRVLQDAHEAARETLRPGLPVSEVFNTVERHVHANGYPRYNRGHVGHSVGIDTFHEEPPYLGPDEHRPLEAGMVLALETPFYGEDLGAIMIEDLVHITDGGHDLLHTMSHDLELVGL
jgi:Xaa-Pro dipeptidase